MILFCKGSQKTAMKGNGVVQEGGEILGEKYSDQSGAG